MLEQPKLIKNTGQHNIYVEVILLGFVLFWFFIVFTKSADLGYQILISSINRKILVSPLSHDNKLMNIYEYLKKKKRELPDISLLLLALKVDVLLGAVATILLP